MNDSAKTNQVAHADRGHHPTSPSSLQALEASPCYIGFAGRTNEAAERGTKQHEAADLGEDHEDLSDAEANAVAMTMDAVQSAVEGMGPDAIVIREGYWKVDNLKSKDDSGNVWKGTSGGFADVVVISKDWSAAVVLDWKFGRWAPEPAENNLQGIAYALGVFNEARSRRKKMLEVTVAFFSPHLDEWTSHTFKAADVPKMLLRVRVVVAKARHARLMIARYPTEMSLYQPTLGTCTFCGRIGECPMMANYALAISKKYQPIVGIPEDIRGLTTLDPAEVKYGIQLSQVMASWSSEYRQRATNKAINNEAFIPDGYQLTLSYPRKVVDVKAMVTIAKKHLPDDVVEGMLKFPITVLEEAIAKNAPRGSKTQAVEELAQELKDANAVVESPTPTVCLRMKNETKNKESKE